MLLRQRYQQTARAVPRGGLCSYESPTMATCVSWPAWAVPRGGLCNGPYGPRV